MFFFFLLVNGMYGDLARLFIHIYSILNIYVVCKVFIYNFFFLKIFNLLYVVVCDVYSTFFFFVGNKNKSNHFGAFFLVYTNYASRCKQSIEN